MVIVMIAAMKMVVAVAMAAVARQCGDGARVCVEEVSVCIVSAYVERKGMRV